MRGATAWRVSFACALAIGVTAVVLGGFAGTDVFLPSVGRKPGSGGSQWYTKAWVHNPGGTAANVQIFLLERDKDNTGAAPFSLVLPAGDTQVFDNAVWTLFAREAFGALRVVSDQKVLVVERGRRVGGAGGGHECRDRNEEQDRDDERDVDDLE